MTARPNNRILQSLSPRAWQAIQPLLEEVPLRRGDVLGNVGTAVTQLYFIDRGIVSLVKNMADGRSVELDAIGVEGITDPFGIFDSERALCESIVQLSGTALRVSRAALIELMGQNGEVFDTIHQYVPVAIGQLAQTAACNSLHAIEQRCARWLLIAHDSALEDSFLLTHEFFAMMLGVRRASVSEAASSLQRAGTIEYARGRVTITDRAALEEAACECYRAIRGRIDRMFPPRGVSVA